MLKRQDKSPTYPTIDQCSTPPVPWSGDHHAIITLNDLAIIFAVQRRTASITSQATDELRFTPARTAQPTFYLGKAFTRNTLRGINRPNDTLQDH
jgi:hypothetical protein